MKVIYSIFALIVLTVFYFAFRSYHKDTTKQQVKAITTHIDTIMAADAKESASSNKEFDSLQRVTDSLQAQYDLEKAKNKTLTKENATLKQRFTDISPADTGAKLNACEEYAAGLEKQVSNQAQQIEDCEEISAGKSQQINNRQKLILLKDRTIDSLYQASNKLADIALKSQPDWWQRNWKAVGVGAFVLGMVTARQIK